MLKMTKKVMSLLQMVLVVSAAVSNETSSLAVQSQDKAAPVPDITQQQALLVLQDLVAESKKYDEVELRVHIKSQAADIVWAFDPQWARDIIIGAFDDAAAIEKDMSIRYKLCSEVIGIARKHDKELVTKLLARFDDKGKESLELLLHQSLGTIAERGALSVEAARRLVAEEKQDGSGSLDLVKRNLSERRAAQLIWFLNQVREKDRTAADKLFLAAVRSLKEIAPDLNNVLYLGLYLFYPGQMIIGSSDDQMFVSEGLDFSAAKPPPLVLLRPYLQASADVLQRVLIATNQSASVKLKHFALRQLQPLFERYDPPLASVMRTLSAQFGFDGPSGISGRPLSNPNTTASLNASTTTELTDKIAAIERLVDTRSRDEGFFAAAKTATDGGDIESARSLAVRISDNVLRQSTLEFVAFSAARKAIEGGELDEAEKIATTHLRQARRAVIYYQLAHSWADRKDIARATELVTSAIIDAAKTENKAERARVYIYLSAGLAKQDALRAFEILGSAVKDINASEKFQLSDEQLTFEFHTPLGNHYVFSLGQGASILSIMPYLARADFNRTTSLAQSLRSDQLRAATIIAACRTVLPGKKQVQ